MVAKKVADNTSNNTPATIGRCNMLLWESPDRMPKPRSWKPCSPHNARPGASPVLGEARVASGRTGCVERGAGASPPVTARDSALARGEGSMVHARVVAHSPTHSPGPTAPHGVNSHTHGITAAKNRRQLRQWLLPPEGCNLGPAATSDETVHSSPSARSHRGCCWLVSGPDARMR